MDTSGWTLHSKKRNVSPTHVRVEAIKESVYLSIVSRCVIKLRAALFTLLSL